MTQPSAEPRGMADDGSRRLANALLRCQNEIPQLTFTIVFVVKVKKAVRSRPRSRFPQ